MAPIFRPSVGRSTIRGSARGAVGSQGAVDARQGMRAVVSNYRRFVQHLTGVTPEILRDALVPTFAVSQTYVPVRSGRLKASGYLEIVGNTVAIGYGRGGSPPYASIVHERVDIAHAPPTRSKFLQAALEEDESNIQARVVEGLRTSGGF